MDGDESSSTVAVVHDIKHEQLQLANDTRQQQVVTEHSQQTTSTDNKQLETTTDQSIATTAEEQHFVEGGIKIKFIYFIFIL